MKEDYAHDQYSKGDSEDGPKLPPVHPPPTPSLPQAGGGGGEAKTSESDKKMTHKAKRYTRRGAQRRTKASDSSGYRRGKWPSCAHGGKKIAEATPMSNAFEIGVASRIMFSKNGKTRAKTRLASTSFGHKKF